ncbi:sphingosine N-acyltransferase lag1 [Dinochytrium kinnereticum]|nr:sphingosine N-acyltransferase lag1 [Dinochytrium kinnereticum]
MNSVDLLAVSLATVAFREHRSLHYNLIAKPLQRFCLCSQRERGIKKAATHKRSEARANTAILTKLNEQTRLFSCHVFNLLIGLWLFTTDAGRQHAPLWLGGSTEGGMDEGIWGGYPKDALEMPLAFRVFYIVQLGFWLDNLLNVNGGELHAGRTRAQTGRKTSAAKEEELWALRFHHTTALVLLVSSYIMHFWRVGHLIVTLMDVSDVLLTLAKSLRYMGQQKACDIAFASFAVSWVITRHLLYLRILWSTMWEATQRIPDRDFDPFGSGSWFHWGTYLFYATVLCALQGLMVRWLMMIVGLVKRVFVEGQHAEDSRSDGEEDDEDEGEDASGEGEECRDLSR